MKSSYAVRSADGLPEVHESTSLNKSVYEASTNEVQSLGKQHLGHTRSYFVM